MHERLPSLLSDIITNERKRRREITRLRVRQALEPIPPGHGRRATVTNQVCSGEMMSRASRWLGIARRLLAKTRAPWTEDNARAISDVLLAAIADDVKELSEIPSNSPISGDASRTAALEAARDYSAARIRAEIDLLILSQESARVPLADQLRGARYAAVRVAWSRAASTFAEEGREDFKPAVLEAVAAVEQLGRLVISNNTATLGDVIRELRRKDLVAAPLLKGIEELWGWTSNEPGVRHGAAASAVVIDLTEARYALQIAEAALGLLIELDL